MSKLSENTWVVLKGATPIFRENVRYITSLSSQYSFYDDGIKSLLAQSINCQHESYEPLTVSQLIDLDAQIKEYLSDKNTMIVVNTTRSETKAPQHYDNSKGSLYQFAEDHQLNSWEFEIIKRITRCRKKGEWLSDIDKTIKVLELYKQEQGHLYPDQTEKLNK